MYLYSIDKLAKWYLDDNMNQIMSLNTDFRLG